ncbi:alpha/beta fold hydrolase [Streptomyces seoulensis]
MIKDFAGVTSAVPSGISRGALTTARGDVAVLRAQPPAAARGTVLLLPGYSKDKHDFLALLPHLSAAGYGAVAVDLHGQDQQAGPRDEAAYAQDALAADVVAQARALGARVHLLGHSLGGHIARAAVLRDDAPFRSLTLLSSGPGHVGDERRAQIELLTAALDDMSMEQLWDVMAKLRPSSASVSPVEADERRLRWLRTSPEHLRIAGAQLLREPDRTAELAALATLPKHVLHGDLDDTWTADLLTGMAERLGARHTVLRETGHAPHVQQPIATAQALTAFWDMTDPRAVGE